MWGCVHLGAQELAALIEAQRHVLAEAGGVVVAHLREASTTLTWCAPCSCAAPSQRGSVRQGSVLRQCAQAVWPCRAVRQCAHAVRQRVGRVARRLGAIYLQLLWRAVLALPVASSIGLDWSRRVERFECSSAEARHTWQGRVG